MTRASLTFGLVVSILGVEMAHGLRPSGLIRWPLASDASLKAWIMTVPANARVTAVTLNSPNPPELARFYARLLGWKITVDKGGWVELPNPNGGIGLSFHIEDVWQRPVWPSRAGEQIMQMHLEVQVDDLEAGAAHAQACGATLADYQPQDDVRVHLDPDGHPFCIYI